MNDTPLIMVEDAEGLQQAIEWLRGEPVLGIDTEADSMHHYKEKVCLIQVSDRTRDYIIDPLAGFSLEPLGELMCDPKVVKIFHGADYDVVSLKRDFDFTITNLFDTMIAAQILDMPKVGLADLVRGYFGVPMDKKYQTHDWSRRPLEDDHLFYARGDTHYLLALRELLLRRLERKRRLDVAIEEFSSVETRVWSSRADGNAAFLRMKGANRLEEDELRVLRCLWEMRDRHAEALDRPQYKVIPDPVLVKLAKSQPKTEEKLNTIIRAKSSMSRRFGADMVEAILKGREDDREIPKPKKKKRTGTKARVGAREAERLLGELKSWRTKVMKRDKVPMVMVASNAQLKAIAGYRPQDLEEYEDMEETRKWQLQRYGEELMGLIADFESKLDKSGKKRRRKR